MSSPSLSLYKNNSWIPPVTRYETLLIFIWTLHMLRYIQYTAFCYFSSDKIQYRQHCCSSSVQSSTIAFYVSWPLCPISKIIRNVFSFLSSVLSASIYPQFLVISLFNCTLLILRIAFSWHLYYLRGGALKVIMAICCIKYDILPNTNIIVTDLTKNKGLSEEYWAKIMELTIRLCKRHVLYNFFEKTHFSFQLSVSIFFFF